MLVTYCRQTLAILGGMQRCDIGLLRVLAQRLVSQQGEVHTWNEENFSQFGILLGKAKLVGFNLVLLAGLYRIA